MDEHMDEYIEIRDKIVSHLDSMVELCINEIWDPLVTQLVVKDIKKEMLRIITEQHPEFPVLYAPRMRLKVYPESHSIDTSVQIFLNTDPSLIYLSSTEYNGALYDLYCSKSWNPSVEYRFYARFGHDPELYLEGDKVAAKEYFTGVVSPLSLAFEMAVEDGFIA